MAGSSRTWTQIESLLRRATGELERAARSSTVASRHERLLNAAAPESPALSLHERMVQIHRQLAERHRTAASIHRTHAERLRLYLGSTGEGVPATFMAAVAETSGADSAVLSLFGRYQAEALVVTSDRTAAAAHDLEITLAEGPGRDAAAGKGLVMAGETELEDRWPLYGPAVHRLGIRAAASVPLGTPDRCIGTITVFGLRSGERSRAESLGTVGDAVTHRMLFGDGDGPDGIGVPVPGDGGGGTRSSVIDGDHLVVVNQAAGMIAGQCGFGIADALAMIRARAFAQGEPIEQVAARVVNRTLRLGSDVMSANDR